MPVSERVESLAVFPRVERDRPEVAAHMMSPTIATVTITSIAMPNQAQPVMP